MYGRQYTLPPLPVNLSPPLKTHISCRKFSPSSTSRLIIPHPLATSRSASRSDLEVARGPAITNGLLKGHPYTAVVGLGLLNDHHQVAVSLV